MLRGGAPLCVSLMLLSGCSATPPEEDQTPTDGASSFGPGPMREPPAQGTVARGVPGTRFTDGLEVLLLDGERAATVLEVRSVGAEDALTFIGAMIAGPTRRLGAWSQLKGYPPRNRALGPLVDAEGATILPRSETRDGIGYELLLGYEVRDDSALAIRTRIEVVYQVGDETFLYSSPNQLVFCPDQLETDDVCLAEAGV